MARLSILIQNHVGEDTFGHLLRIAAGSISSPGFDLDRYRAVTLFLEGAVDTYLVAYLDGS